MRMRLLLVALGSSVMGIVAGVISSDIFRLSLPVVVVEVLNSSDKRINELQLRHSHGLAQLTDIASGERKNLAFYVPGESGYKIRVVFADQQVLEGGAGYVQSGSKWSEIITAKEIKSQYVGNY